MSTVASQMGIIDVAVTRAQHQSGKQNHAAHAVTVTSLWIAWEGALALSAGLPGEGRFCPWNDESGQDRRGWSWIARQVILLYNQCRHGFVW